MAAITGSFFFIFAGKSLLWVACLLLIIIFIYAVISFALFRDSFDRANNIFCATLEECFVSVLRFGLIDHFLVSIYSIIFAYKVNTLLLFLNLGCECY